MRPESPAEQPREPGPAAKKAAFANSSPGEAADHFSTFAATMEYEPFAYTC